MNSLNVENIVDVQISVSKTVASATRFGHMLIICPAPKTPGSASTPPVGAYSALTALEELETAGFTDADPVYGAMQMVLKANKAAGHRLRRRPAEHQFRRGENL